MGTATTPDEMRQHVLRHIEDATGSDFWRVGHGREQTYRLSSGGVFYLRTRAHDARTPGRYAYWFGIREECWDNPDHFLVLACDVDFTLVVPVADWLPHRERISVAKAGTPQQNRQPHIYWEGTTYELREGGFVLDVAPWVDRYDLLAG